MTTFDIRYHNDRNEEELSKIQNRLSTHPFTALHEVVDVLDDLTDIISNQMLIIDELLDKLEVKSFD